MLAFEMIDPAQRGYRFSLMNSASLVYSPSAKSFVSGASDVILNFVQPVESSLKSVYLANVSDCPPPVFPDQYTVHLYPPVGDAASGLAIDAFILETREQPIKQPSASKIVYIYMG